MKILKSFFSVLFWIIIIFLGFAIFQWWNFRSPGGGINFWYFPFLLIILLFLGVLSFFILEKHKEFKNITLTEGIQSISAVFSVFFVIFGLFFAVSKFGHESLEREAQRDRKTTGYIENSIKLEKELRALKNEMLKQPEGTDIAVKFKLQIQESYDNYRVHTSRVEDCLRYEECNVQSTQRFLCELAEVFGVYDKNTITSYNVSAFGNLMDLIYASESKLVKHCPFPQIIGHVLSLN